MKVVAEAPWNWFLFEDDGRLYLEALVEHGAVSFTVAAELDAEATNAWHGEGQGALDRVAAGMRDKALRREWVIPPLPADWSARSGAAVQAWKMRGG